MKTFCKALLCCLLGFSAMVMAVGLERSIVIGNKSAITLSADNCQIVVAPHANYTVKYAAGELQHFLSEILGGEIKISETPGNGSNIYVGVCESSEKQKLDVGKLTRDGFYIRTVGKDIYILGKDDPKGRTDLNAKSGGAWDHEYELATLFGVYDFLERFCGIRFYFPGELGTIVPKQKAISVPEINIVEKPDMRRRFYGGWWDGEYFEGENRNLRKHPQKNTQMYRNRFGTENMNTNHGIYGFSLPQRFGKTHPEYFRMNKTGVRQAEGQFSGQLCWTSGVREKIYQDMRSYFIGEPATVRGVLDYNGKPGWFVTTFRKGYVDVMPQDSFEKCYCKNCMATYTDVTEDYATEMIWNNVIDWANRLKQENIKGVIAMSAYYPYTDVPKRPIPDNVEVQVCVTGPWVCDASMWKQQKQRVMDWNKKLGRPVHLWNYTNKSGSARLPGIPSYSPRSIARFYKEVAPYIFGSFLECQCDKFIYFAMNYYVYGKIMWNTQTDIDKLMDEYYSLMFGKAAPIMKKVMDDFEYIWVNQIAGRTVNTSLGPVASVPSDHTIWNEIYSPAKLKQLRDDFDKAAKMVDANSLEAKRIAFFRREYLEPLFAASEVYLKRTSAVQGLRFRIPGSSIHLTPFVGRKPTPIVGTPVQTKVNARWTDDALVVKFDCEEPHMADIVENVRKHDDVKMWEDSSVEIFLSPAGDCKKVYQWMINTRGDIYDACWTVLGRSAVEDSTWESGATVDVKKHAKGFVMEVKIPKKNLGPIKAGGFPVNFGRNRILKKGNEHMLYSWSPYIYKFHDYENFGWMVPDDKEMVVGGNFDDINALDKRYWGYRTAKGFFGWNTAQGLEPGKSGCAMDSKVFYSAPRSMKLVSVDAKKGVALCQYFDGKKFKPNTTYRVSCAVKFKDVVPGATRSGVYINLWDDANRFFPKNPLTGTSDWTYLSFLHKTSANVDKCKRSYLVIWLMKSTGTLWIDDVSVEEVTK